MSFSKLNIHFMEAAYAFPAEVLISGAPLFVVGPEYPE